MKSSQLILVLEKKSNIRLLKVKRSQNGTFSVSKAWNVDDIRQIEIVDVNAFYEPLTL